ncbi:MAG: PAS domain S-box protein [Bacillota bacterium]|nr:PAS domain S-box protein [Bacillota bacterium]
MNKHRSAEELRRQAEEKILDSKRKIAPPVAPEELQRLVQELEVHQIELEIQNEELQQAHSELERYLGEYTNLYDFAPVGYLTLDQSGFILRANLTGATMLGLERSKILNQHFEKFITAQHRHAFKSFLEKVFFNRARDTFEITLQIKENESNFVHIEAMVLEDQRECRIALMDITAQKKAEEELRESERQFRTLYETMTQGVLYQDPDCRIISANPAAEKIFGLSFNQMQGRSPKDLQWLIIQEDGSDLPEEAQPYMVALRTGEVINNAVMGLYSPQAGRYTWLKITAVPQFKPGDDKPFQVILTIEDISLIKGMIAYNKLTPREKEVFKLLAKGQGRQLISDKLRFSPKTADKHKENLMNKLELYSQDDIIKFARLINLL